MLHILCRECGNYSEEYIIDLIEMLMQSSKVPYIKDEGVRGWTPLHFACHWQTKERMEVILKVAVEQNIDVNEEEDIFGSTAAHMAFEKGFDDHHSKSFTERENVRGLSPFRFIDVILKYAKKVGINLEATDNEGSTPLHRLCQRNYLQYSKKDIEHFLEMAKAEYGIEFNLNATDNDGQTPMDYIDFGYK